MSEENIIDEKKLKKVVPIFKQSKDMAKERQERKDKEDYIFDYLKEDKLDQFDR